MPELEPLTNAEVGAYMQLLEQELSGEEQSALRSRDPDEYRQWLDAQLAHVPIPSHQKPDINGFREGDGVRLTQAFQGETVAFEAGRTGVLLITNTSPAQIRLARTVPLYEVLVDGSDGQLIAVNGEAIERIPRKHRVTYDGEYVTCEPVVYRARTRTGR